MSLNNLASCLSALGQREEALAAIEEAVTTYRTLARTRPDAFLPDLALSLNNLATCLSGLEQREEALTAIEEALTIRRALAYTRRNTYLLSLAQSLAGWPVGMEEGDLSSAWILREELDIIGEVVTGHE